MLAETINDHRSESPSNTVPRKVMVDLRHSRYSENDAVYRTASLLILVAILL